MVGQKNVFPIPYINKAIIAPAKVSIPLLIFNPTHAAMALTSRIPIGERPSFSSIQPAQNRRPNIQAEVNTNRILPSSDERMLPVIFWIHPSVPSSTAPTSACVMKRTKSRKAPTAHLNVAPKLTSSAPAIITAPKVGRLNACCA